MPSLGQVSSREAVAALKRLGFEEHRQSGSHLVLRHRTDGRRAVVPMHSRRDVAPGTLRRLLAAAGVGAEEFLRAL